MEVSILKPCPECGHAGKLILATGFVAQPVGSFSLAGAGMKFSANQLAYLRCDRCKMNRRGKVQNLGVGPDGITAVSGEFVQERE